MREKSTEAGDEVPLPPHYYISLLLGGGTGRGLFLPLLVPEVHIGRSVLFLDENFAGTANGISAIGVNGQ